MKNPVENDDLAEELRQVLARYDLGELVDFERNQRGFVNTSFAIQTVKDGTRTWRFMRKYKPGIREDELLFEHTPTDHLSQQPIPPVARVHRTSLLLALEDHERGLPRS